MTDSTEEHWVDRTVTRTFDRMWRSPYLGTYEGQPRSHDAVEVAVRETVVTEGTLLGEYPDEGEVFYSSESPVMSRVRRVVVGPWKFVPDAGDASGAEG